MLKPLQVNMSTPLTPRTIAKRAVSLIGVPCLFTSFALSYGSADKQRPSNKTQGHRVGGGGGRKRSVTSLIEPSVREAAHKMV